MVSFMRRKAGTATQLLRRAVSRCFLKQRRREALISQGEGEVPGTMVAALKQKFRAGSSRKDGMRLRGNLAIRGSCNTADRGPCWIISPFTNLNPCRMEVV